MLQQKRIQHGAEKRHKWRRYSLRMPRFHGRRTGLSRHGDGNVLIFARRRPVTHYLAKVKATSSEKRRHRHVHIYKVIGGIGNITTGPLQKLHYKVSRNLTFSQNNRVCTSSSRLPCFSNDLNNKDLCKNKLEMAWDVQAVAKAEWPLTKRPGYPCSSATAECFPQGYFTNKHC